MIKTHLITGRLGSGKTSLIKQFLDQRPNTERWAIVVNEFGQIGLDAALLTIDEDQSPALVEITGGCICCASSTQLRVQLNQLIRQYKPDRLFIEATGLGHPAGIIDLLRDEYFQPVLTVSSVIAVFDLSLFSAPPVLNDTGSADRNPLNTPLFHQQSELADIVVLNKQDLSNPDQEAIALRFFKQLYPVKTSVIITQNADVDITVLDLEGTPRTTTSHCQLTAVHHDELKQQFELNGANIQYSYTSQTDTVSFGWIIPATEKFSRVCLKNLFEDYLADSTLAIIRLKAVFNCGKFWYSFNAIDGRLTVQESYYRRDSRIECISENISIKADEFWKKIIVCLQT